MDSSTPGPQAEAVPGQRYQHTKLSGWVCTGQKLLLYKVFGYTLHSKKLLQGPKQESCICLLPLRI